ncbi:MAG: hypothetical protein Q4A01_04085 [Coriobacteriales bacterium]|nr:hypothetical protein [Coriobacteriales bacterium]
MNIPVESIVLNGVIAPLSVIAWLQLALASHATDDQTRLASRGVESLKYFTVLSNLLSALTCLAYLVSCCLLGLLPVWLVVCKLVATTAVMITFLTVIAILGPAFGWKKMYEGGNLWLHLVLPLLAAVDLCLFVPVGQLTVWLTLLGMCPTLLYGVGYLGALLRHGPEENGKVYDFYGFLRWGENKVPVVAVAMLFGSWVVALLMYGLNYLLHAL